MRKKIRKYLTNIWDNIEYRLRLLCGKPSPIKQFMTVLIIGIVLTVANIYFVVSSVYHIGKRDAEKEFITLQHIETLKLHSKNDSINIFNQKEYEYKQSDK